MVTQNAVPSPGRTHSAVEQEPNSPRGFHLHHHQVQRAREIAGHAGVAVLYSLAAHADNATGKCHTTVRTISRESGVGRKKLPGVIAELAGGGVIDRQGRTTLERKLMPGGAFEYTIIRTDGPRGFVPVSQEWMRQHAALSPAQLSAHAMIRALGNGRWKFKMEFDKARLQLGVPRATFYRLLDALAEHRLVRHYRVGTIHWWELPELEPPKAAPIKRFLAVRFHAPLTPPLRASQVVCHQQNAAQRETDARATSDSASVPKLTPDPAPEAVASVSKLPTELYKSKPSVDLDVDVDVDLGFEVEPELDKPDTGSALRAAATSNPSNSQDQDQDQNLAAPTHDDCECHEGWLSTAKGNVRCKRWQAWVKAGRLVSAAWLHKHNCDGGKIKLADGELVLCPQCAASVPIENHGCEHGWRITDREHVWQCPYCRAREHGCVGREYSKTEKRLIASRDEHGEIVLKPCPQCAAEYEAKRREAEGRNGMFAGWTFAKPSTPALPPAAIEGEWRESKKPAASVRERAVGDVLPPAMYNEYWKRIEIEINIFRADLDKSTRKRIDGMLHGGVAKFGPDRFHEAMRDAQRERWETKHGRCHEGEDCDGSCGHDFDECGGYATHFQNDKALLDMIGNAIQLLRDDGRFGRSADNNCPNAVYGRMYPAA